MDESRILLIGQLVSDLIFLCVEADNETIEETVKRMRLATKRTSKAMKKKGSLDTDNRIMSTFYEKVTDAIEQFANRNRSN